MRSVRRSAPPSICRRCSARSSREPPSLPDADAGVIYEYDEQREVFEPRATERLEDDIVQTLVATPVRKGQGATGRLAEMREPIQLADLRAPGEQLPVRDALIRAGYRALLAVPLVREDHLIGGLTVFRKTPGAFAAEIVDLLKTFATQSSLAIQNARLFREIGRRAGSSKSPASTSPSSSPTCPTSCAPRSTPSSATASCWRRRPGTWTAGGWCPICRRSPPPPNTSSP